VGRLRQWWCGRYGGDFGGHDWQPVRWEYPDGEDAWRVDLRLRCDNCGFETQVQIEP
jgi:hypothetical protein